MFVLWFRFIGLHASSAIIYLSISTMGSKDSIENSIISENFQDLEGICSGILRTELNKPNNSVRTSSLVGVSESLREREKENSSNDIGEMGATDTLAPNKQASPSDAEKKIASRSNGKKDGDCVRFSPKVSCNDVLGALSMNNKASPSDAEKENAPRSNGKKHGHSPRFKRKLSSVSSSQPVCGNDSETTTNWKIEYKKQAMITKRMRLRGDRAKEKLELVRAELKKINEILFK